MIEQYQFHPNLVLRSPKLPLETQVDKETLAAQVNDPVFMEAVYLASPVLYEECRKMKEGVGPDVRGLKKINSSLTKYYTRMFSRCTPFGLFSGCAVANWGTGETNLVVDPEGFDRHTRFDMHYLCALAQFLSGFSGIKEQLGFTRNSTLYFIGNEARYIEYYYNQGKRTHKISSILRNEYIDRVLSIAAHGFHSIQDYCTELMDEDINLEEASEFIHGLIEAQVLVSELEPSVTGPEFIHQMMKSLNQLKPDKDGTILSIRSFLLTALKELDSLDEGKINAPARYKSIQEMLQMIQLPFDESKLFQCDLSVKLSSGQVSAQYQSQLRDALIALHRLSPVQEQSMDLFIRDFKERYEDREMSLLEVLDTETGIVYKENSGVELSPLLNDLVLLKPDQPINFQWGKLEEFWHKKLDKTKDFRAVQIELTDKDLEEFPEKAVKLPPSISLLFRVVDAEKSLLFIESAAGSSAANLLGRFAHSNVAINELVHSITEKEQELEKEIIFAEIVHLPESRIGNILLHPAFRTYEIPYLSKSSVDEKHQLPVQDLMISVRKNKILLRSKSLNKEIIPRLSSAHNYNLQPLPVYQFLCDLQTQGIANGFSFSWGDISFQHKFLPRVLYRQTILHAATWQLRKEDWEYLINVSDSELLVKLIEFRNTWQLPDKVVIADGDNELLIDFSNSILRSVFLDLIQKRQSLVIREFLYTNSTGVRDLMGNNYANQFLAILQKKEATYTTAVSKIESAREAECFSIGSEWLYYKIYCGSQSAEKILVQAVYPLVEELKETGKIDNWFFIRYTDPAFHIRLRFHLTDISKLGEIMQAFTSSCSTFVKEGFIWRIQLDSYQRELQRYGSRSIEAVEKLFCLNSVSTLQWLSHEVGDEREEERWIWGLQWIDYLLDHFELDLEKKTNLLERIKTSFAEEFHTGKLLKDQLDTRYRLHRKKLETRMGEGFVFHSHDGEVANSVRFILNLHRLDLLEPELDNLLASLIHMQLNRLFTSKPRQHEMVCYDFLYRYYFAKMMRKSPSK
ncbi:lantibiotic dehydratase [Flavihumibacter sp. UBA7668]|uniref:lantibiotic dehydratase n=1 Tax=Flavihumibacter sp. UBA7668 TaxID=1946542 RepID=UPI0025BCE0BF|nr:lantibiotic dehydratase [Flavihumibacter sp. UBA7668]